METFKLSDTKKKIITFLSSGQFVSGEWLGNELGISRAAIAKHMKSITALGLDVFSVTGKGYRLAEPLQMLSTERIATTYPRLNDIHVFSVIDSTNQFIMDLLRSENELADGTSVLAECQTQGRGRRGREWISPFGSHLYLSRYYKSYEGLSAASGLSLAIGIAIARTVKKMTGADAKLKWPNDVLVDDKKISGVLVEAEGQSDGVCHLVVGIGLNVLMPESSASKISQPWTDLNTISSEGIDRNELAGLLLAELDDVMNEYRLHKLSNLLKEWNIKNAYKNQVVSVTTGNNTKSGRCLGIDENGALILSHVETNIQFKIYGGEVSLRRQLSE